MVKYWGGYVLRLQHCVKLLVGGELGGGHWAGNKCSDSGMEGASFCLLIHLILSWKIQQEIA